MKNIFVSSTFRDMQAERDMIQEEVLPKLKNKAKKYGENINIIDLRWGVDTSELESEEGSMKVMSVCLDEVERSRPYMLIFLGERYGSIIDPVITEKVIMRQNSGFTLEDYAISITAMEVEFGALSEAYGDLDNCIVCIRNFDAVSITGVNDRAVYCAENAEMAKKQQAFKEKVIDKLQGRVIEYTCSWDEEKKQLVDFRTLDGGALSDKLVGAYEEMFCEEWEAYSRLSWEEKEQLSVSAIMESKLKSFKGRQVLIDYYYDKVCTEAGTLILQGKVGSGKTSIMCKLMEKLEQSGRKVFRFIAGDSSMSENAMQLMQQMVYYLESILGTEHYKEQEEKSFQYTDWRERLEELAALLNGEEKIYLVIDAVDQMHQDEHTRQLDFLLPDNSLRYVISCTDEFVIPTTYHVSNIVVEQIPLLSVQDAKDVIEGMLAASSRNAYKDIVTEILSKKSANNPLYISMLIQRLNMMGFDELYSAWSESDIISHGCEVIKNMPDGEMEATVFIINEAVKKLGTQPQVLKDVVNMLGISRSGLRENDIIEISKEFGNQVSQLDIARFMHYLDNFFVVHQDGRIDFTHKVIRKGIRESVGDNKYIKAIAARVKSLDVEDELWKSEGMYYARITEDAKAADRILKYAYQSDDKVVRDAIREEGLADKGDFYCKNMELMPEGSLFFCFSWRNLFDIGTEEYALKERINRKFVACFEAANAVMANDDSLHFLALGYKNTGEVLLEQGNAVDALEFFEKAMKAFEELFNKKNTLQSLRELADAYNNVGRACQKQGRIEEALDYYVKSMDVRKEIDEQGSSVQSLSELSVSYGSVGNALYELGRTREALEYYEKVLEIQMSEYKMGRTLKQLRGVAISGGNIGNVLLAQGEYDEALEYYLNALKLCEDLYSRSRSLQSLKDLSICYNYVGQVLQDKGNAREALGYLEKAVTSSEEIYRRSENIQSLRDLLIGYNNVGRALELQGRVDEALVYFRKMLDAGEVLHNRTGTLQSLKELSTSYNNIGLALRMKGNEEQAREYLQKALESLEVLYTKSGNLESLREFAVACNNMGNALLEQKELEEAMEYFEKCMEAREELHEKSGTIQSLKELSAIYYNVGTTLLYQKKQEEGFAYLKKSLEADEELYHKIGDIQSLKELIGSYKTLGERLFNYGKEAEAMEYFAKAKMARGTLLEALQG